MAAPKVTLPKVVTQNKDVNQVQQNVETAVNSLSVNIQSAVQAAINAAIKGFSIIPPGTIAAFGGATVPAGWLMCDGTSYSAVTYPNLAGAMWNGANFNSGGSGNQITGSFNVPDLRGKFLRGTDGTANYDPDHASRTAINTGGNTGNAVGSLQMDQIVAHGHDINLFSIPAENAGNLMSGGVSGPHSWTALANNTGALNTGGNETRPRNVYVNFIIKT